MSYRQEEQEGAIGLRLAAVERRRRLEQASYTNKMKELKKERETRSSSPAQRLGRGRASGTTCCPGTSGVQAEHQRPVAAHLAGRLASEVEKIGQGLTLESVVKLGMKAKGLLVVAIRLGAVPEIHQEGVAGAQTHTGSLQQTCNKIK